LSEADPGPGKSLASDARGDAPPTSSRPARQRKKKRRWGRAARNWVAGVAGPWIVRFWIGSLRVRIVREFLITDEPRIPRRGVFLFWHQRMLVLAGAYRHSGFRVLISQHGDGEMIARIIHGLGMSTIRGSSTRGGARACLEMLRALPSGPEDTIRLAITPDGPRGPRHVLQEGAIYIASRTGLPIYLVAVSARWHWKLPTWDGFLLPWPGSRAIVRISGPIQAPPDLDRDGIERLRAEAERGLRALTDETDQEFDALYPRGTRD